MSMLGVDIIVLRVLLKESIQGVYREYSVWYVKRNT